MPTRLLQLSLFGSALLSSTLLLEATSSAAERAAEGDAKPRVPDDVVARPGVFNESPLLPSEWRGWAQVSGGAMPDATGKSGPAAEAAALWTFVPRFALGASLGSTPRPEGERAFVPAVALYGQLLTERTSGLDLTASARYRTLGPEVAGSQLLLRVNAGRSLGPAYAALNGAVGQGFGSRGDVDFEGGALAYVRVARIVRLGGEGRTRGELVDRYETAEDEGRPVEILTGGTFGVDLGPVLAQALGGWSWPRGPAASGPTALASASFSF